jgi:hypothetical protein
MDREPSGSLCPTSACLFIPGKNPATMSAAVLPRCIGERAKRDTGEVRMFPFSDVAGPEGQRIGISMIGAAVVFVVLFKLIYALFGENHHDVAMLFGTVIPTFAALSVPYFVVRMMGEKTRHAAKHARRHA